MDSKNLLDDMEIAAINKAAGVIARHATEHSEQTAPTSEFPKGMMGSIPMILPPPVGSFIDGLKHLLALDDRMLRVCVIVESESPLNTDPIHDENMRLGEILVSFGLAMDDSEDIQFINFGLSVEEDLSNLASLYTSITVMEEQLRGILDGSLNPDGSEVTGGEDSNLRLN